MSNEPADETRAFWDRIAADWDRQVGDDGDANRILNSDPVLWEMVGDVAGLDVLDAGCGTGYLARKLHNRGARVVGVDFSARMIEIARARAPDLAFHCDTCSELGCLANVSFDRIVANYVLMDTPDLEGTVRTFRRVLRPGGVAVLVFSHPCFPQARAEEEGYTIRYRWSFPYFERRKCVDPPWGHFTSDFIWFHRPLSDYWKAFTTAGFVVDAFDEPRLTPDREHLAPDDRRHRNCRTRPYSVAFRLRKP